MKHCLAVSLVSPCGFGQVGLHGGERRGGVGLCQGRDRDLAELHLSRCPDGQEIGGPRLGRGPAEQPRLVRLAVQGLGSPGMREC